MPVFNIPAEYYGLVGIGNAIGNIGEASRAREDRARKQKFEDFTFQQAQDDALRKQEQDIINRTGQGSQEHIDFLKAHGLPTDGILVPQEVRNSRRISELSAIPEDQRTALQNAELNQLEGKPIEGLQAQLDSIARKTDIEKLQVDVAKLNANEARLNAEQRMAARDFLQKRYHISPAELDAMTQWQAYQQTGAQLELTQAEAANQRAEAAVRNETANSGYDPTQIRQITNELNKFNTGKPFTTDQVKKGLNDQLFGNEAERFRRAYTVYNLTPQYKEVTRQIDDINNEIIDAQNRLASARKNKDQTTIDELNVRIKTLSAQGNKIKAQYEATRDAAFGVGSTNPTLNPAGSTTPQTTASGVTGVPTGQVFPEELQKAVAAQYPSLDAIDANATATPEEKSQLKAIWIAAHAKDQTAPPPKAVTTDTGIVDTAKVTYPEVHSAPTKKDTPPPAKKNSVLNNPTSYPAIPSNLAPRNPSNEKYYKEIESLTHKRTRIDRQIAKLIGDPSKTKEFKLLQDENFKINQRLNELYPLVNAAG